MTNLRDAFRPASKRRRWPLVAGAVAGAGIFLGGYLLAARLTAEEDMTEVCTKRADIYADAMKIRSYFTDSTRARDALRQRMRDQGVVITDMVEATLISAIGDAYRTDPVPLDRLALLELEAGFAHRDALDRCLRAYASIAEDRKNRP